MKYLVIAIVTCASLMLTTAQQPEWPVCNPSEVTWHPHPYTCTRYILCFHGNPIERLCAPGLHYSRFMEQCMFPQLAMCDKNYACPDEDDKMNPVFLPNFDSCSKYFVCFKGEAIARDCAENLWWDVVHQWCMIADDVTCDSRTPDDPNRETTTPTTTVPPTTKPPTTTVPPTTKPPTTTVPPTTKPPTTTVPPTTKPPTTTVSPTTKPPTTTVSPTTKPPTTTVPPTTKPPTTTVPPTTKPPTTTVPPTTKPPTTTVPPTTKPPTTTVPTTTKPPTTTVPPTTKPPTTTVPPTTTEAITTTTQNPNTYDCPLDAEPSFHPHSLECELYFICVNGFPFLQRCAEGLYFDVVNRKCQNPEVAVCYSGTKDPGHEVTLPAYSFACPLHNYDFLLFPHESKCERFYKCELGVAHIYICEEGQIYDVNESKCKNKSEAVCLNDL